MPTKISKYTFTKIHFVCVFWMVAGFFFLLKCLFPNIAGKQLEEVKEYIEAKITTNHHHPVDSISRNMAHVDSLFFAPRADLMLVDAAGNPIKNEIPRFRSIELDTIFPDINDVQLVTAERLGIPECDDRQAAAAMKDKLVYIGDSPYYDLENLTYSIPYLVPRASVLLEEISRSFFDSLAVKGIPFHKLIVTSVLRTNKDVKGLRRHNGNASENSCHRFGTTFDIAYNSYHRVQDPDDSEQPQEYAYTLKSVLAEVLNDQRLRGTCYVKYERRQYCFHITCR